MIHSPGPSAWRRRPKTRLPVSPAGRTEASARCSHLRGGSSISIADFTPALDVFGRAASVRIDASGWVDYPHLIQTAAGGKIIKVLWERREPAHSTPPGLGSCPRPGTDSRRLRLIRRVADDGRTEQGAYPASD